MTFGQFIDKVIEAKNAGIFIENDHDFVDILINANPDDFENIQEYKDRIENEEHLQKLELLYGTHKRSQWDRRKLYKKLKTKKELKEEEKFVGEKLIYFRNQLQLNVNSLTRDYIKDRVAYYLEWVQEVQRWIKVGFEKSKNDDDFKIKLQKAKEFPIENILDFTGRKAKCPWHNEKTASLYLNKDNTVYCFGCNKFGDAVEVASEYYKCSFVEAVNRLAN